MPTWFAVPPPRATTSWSRRRAKHGTWCWRRLRAWRTAGLPKEWLKPGAMATVEGYANRNKPEEMRAERITINGKTIELR